MARPDIYGSHSNSLPSNPNTYRTFINSDQPNYTTLKTYPDMSSGHNVWLPGPSGIIPNDTDPPRYELKHVSEHMVTFDHHEPKKFMDKVEDVTIRFSHRFWGEFFSALYVVLEFFVVLVLEAVGLVIKVVASLVLGIFIRIADYFIKPLVVFIHNTTVVTSMSVMANTISSAVVVVQPLMDLAQRAAEIIAIPIQAFRLFEYRNSNVLQPQNEAMPI